MWRQIAAGILSISIGIYDLWFIGRDRGLSSQLDELIILGGLGLIAGIPSFFIDNIKRSIKNDEDEPKRNRNAKEV